MVEGNIFHLLQWHVLESKLAFFVEFETIRANNHQFPYTVDRLLSIRCRDEVSRKSLGVKMAFLIEWRKGRRRFRLDGVQERNEFPLEDVPEGGVVWKARKC